MEFIVWVETRLAGKRLEIQEVAKVEREVTGVGPEELGLTLADGKTVVELHLNAGRSPFDVNSVYLKTGKPFRAALKSRTDCA
jgi:hypothetical protein